MPPDPPPTSRPRPPPNSTQSILIPAPALASSRYNRQLLIPSISLRGQTLLSQTKVLIVGLGGLGCPAALYLAGAGVHSLGLVDGDIVELSNLHRQVLHREDSVGWSKVDSAVRGLREVNSEVEVVKYKERLDASTALSIVEKFDIVLDCTDNPATRYLISDACVLKGKPLVSGAAQRTEGQLMVLNYPVGNGPCYRCVFPRAPAPETVLGCSEIGVLGPVVGVVGVLMAVEAIKMIVETNEEREAQKPSLLLYNAFNKEARGRFRAVGLRGKRKQCVACGSEAGDDQITVEKFEEGGMDYEAFCGRVEDVMVLRDWERVGVKDFLNLFGGREGSRKQGKDPLVVDVREPTEFELGAKIRGSVNIPISRILRHGGGDGSGGENVFDGFLKAGEEGDEQRPVYFVCQRGNDSQIAARNMIEARMKAGDGKAWVGDVRGGLAAMEKEFAEGGDFSPDRIRPSTRNQLD